MQTCLLNNINKLNVMPERPEVDQIYNWHVWQPTSISDKWYLNVAHMLNLSFMCSTKLYSLLKVSFLNIINNIKI